MTASNPDSPLDPATGPTRPASPTKDARTPAAPPEALIASAVGPDTDHAPEGAAHGRVDFTSAVYGSVVAGTVIVTAGPAQPVALAVMLVVSGIVFWLAHVYALTVANVHGGWEIGAIRKGLRKEWPVAFAAIPPAVAALPAALFEGISPADGAWMALTVAIIEQQAWGYAAARRSKMSGLPLVRTITLNVVIGIVVVTLKIAVGH